MMIAGFLTESAVAEASYSVRNFSFRQKNQKRSQRISKYCRYALRILNVQFVETPAKLELNPGLIVSNHLSYVDVLVLAALFPSLFVTSVEVKNQSFVGPICKMAGCLFVERRSRENLSQEVRDIHLAMSTGSSVVIFPEATSTDGSKVLPFKAALYQSAIDAQTPVHHFCIRYLQSEVPYYGDMTFDRHLGSLLALDRIDVQLRYLGTFDEPQKTSRFELAQMSHRLVQHAYLSQ